MAESVPETAYEGKPGPSIPHDEPNFLDRVDTALGLELAAKSSVTISPPESDIYSGQVVSSPISMERNPTGKLRPGFFGAGGSLYGPL
jgi:hypothetical protein